MGLFILKFGFSEKATKFQKVFVILLTIASCSVRATAYLSKSWRRFFKTNVVKSNYTNITNRGFSIKNYHDTNPICNWQKILVIINFFFSFFGIVGILECGTILHSIITNFVFVFLIIYVLMENLKMLFIMVMSAFTIDQSSATIQCKCQKFC